MNKNSRNINHDVAALADDARALVNATADVAGEKVTEARERLAAALDRGREMYGRVREKAVDGARATNKAVHEHPYQTLAIGVGVGAILGYLLSRRRGGSPEE